MNVNLINGLYISDIRIHRVPNQDDVGLKAYVEIVLNDAIAAGSIRLFRNEDGKYALRYPINPSSKRKLAYFMVLGADIRSAVLDEVVDIFENS